jgi:site-specific recombinase XerD
MENARLRLISPSTVIRTVPLRRPNRELRTREHLTEAEVERLITVAKGNRHGHRDSTMILVAFRHGLRCAELVDLRWEQVHFAEANLAVRRVKNGLPSTHPLSGRELRALRRLQRESPSSEVVFVTERGAPFTTAGFAKMFERVAAKADIGIKAHVHMLRHATGYALANKGHDTRSLQSWMGHANIQHTCVYTALSPDRFKNFWRD